MSDHNEINKGIASHGYWKVRLRDAIETGKSDWNPDNVRQDKLCDFGKWFYALSAQDQASEFWKKVQPLHVQFHAEAGIVLKLAIEGHKEEAVLRMSDLQGEFSKTSISLVNTLNEWKKSCQQ